MALVGGTDAPECAMNIKYQSALAYRLMAQWSRASLQCEVIIC